MNKVVKFFMLTFLLVALPLISYMYLTKGINFRKEIIKDLKNKTPFSDFIGLASKEVLHFKDKCTVVSINASKEDVKNIYLQFKEAKGFQLLSEYESTYMKTVFENTNTNQEEILKRSYLQIDSATVVNMKNKYPKNSFVIIDSLANVRRSYTESLEEKQKLVAHITALLPYFDEKKGR